MLKESDCRKIAEKLGREFHYGKYRMWRDVPFIGNTALVADVIAPGGGYALLSLRSMEHRITMAYLLNAIRHDAHSLGLYDMRRKKHVFTTWLENLGKYPPGYFTHRVGEDLTETVVDKTA